MSSQPFDPRRLNWVHADPSCSCDAEHGAVPEGAGSKWEYPDTRPGVGTCSRGYLCHWRWDDVNGVWENGSPRGSLLPGDTGPDLWWAWMGGGS